MKGKVAIVTGGAGGIGSAICKAYANEGADVAAGDIDLEKADTLAKEIASGGLRV